MAKPNTQNQSAATGSDPVINNATGTSAPEPVVQTQTPPVEPVKQTPPAETPKPAEEETVQVKKSDLDAIFKKLEDLSKDNKTLFQVADKSRLARLSEKEGAALIRQVKVSKWPKNDQYIIGWKLTKNMSEILPHTGRWVEDQATTLVFEDGTVEEIPLIEFYRTPLKETADIVETNNLSKNGMSYTILTVEFANGKRLSIDSKFIN